MLTSITIEGFKNLRSLSLTPGRFTVLVGPNGAGKSSVLQAIHLASQLPLEHPGEHSYPRRRLSLIFGGRWSLKKIASHKTERLSIRLQDQRGLLEVSTRHPDAEEDRTFDLQLDQHQTTLPDLERFKKYGTPPAWFAPVWLDDASAHRFSGVTYLHLNPEKLIAASEVDEQPYLHDDGAGLASVLAYLAGAEPERKAAIEADLRKVVPQVRAIRTAPAKIPVVRRRPFPVGSQSVEVPVEEEVLGQRFWLEMAGGLRVDADQLSEGTVIALGLLTVLHSPSAPWLVLLDDLDRALHLGAQVRLVQILHELLERRPELQIICTSHSPFLLQEVKPHDVVVLAPDDEGWAHARRLDEHPEYARWRAALSTGELWATLGEAWVLK